MKRKLNPIKSKRSTSKRLFNGRFAKLLSRSRLSDILVMVWAVDALRKGESKFAAPHISFPKEAISAKPGDKHYLAPWLLETLVNEALTHRSLVPQKGKMRVFNTRKWQSFATMFNLLNKIEDLESMDDIPDGDILLAMPRLGWRQFGWQLGYFTPRRIYRSWWLYNFDESNEYFEKNFGISLERFCFVGFCIGSQCIKHPKIALKMNLSKVGVSETELKAFWNLVSLQFEAARKKAITQRTGRGLRAYKPSILRQTPVIKFGSQDVAICPLPDLLFLRISDGLFYDLVNNGQVRQLISKRFENYAFEITNHYIAEGFELLSETRYGSKKKPIDTPDIRVVDQSMMLRAIVECKARKIPYSVLSSPNPFQEHEDLYAEVVKGVVQIWRYAANVRLEKSDKDWLVTKETIGVVLTLEPWLQMASDLVGQIRAAAVNICSDEYPEISEADQIPVVFVSIDEWESSICGVEFEAFLSSLSLHAAPEKAGFMLNHTVEHMDAKNPAVSAYNYSEAIERTVEWWKPLWDGEVP